MSGSPTDDRELETRLRGELQTLMQRPDPAALDRTLAAVRAQAGTRPGRSGSALHWIGPLAAAAAVVAATGGIIVALHHGSDGNATPAASTSATAPASAYPQRGQVVSSKPYIAAGWPQLYPSAGSPQVGRISAGSLGVVTTGSGTCPTAVTSVTVNSATEVTVEVTVRPSVTSASGQPMCTDNLIRFGSIVTTPGIDPSKASLVTVVQGAARRSISVPPLSAGSSVPNGSNSNSPAPSLSGPQTCRTADLQLGQSAVSGIAGGGFMTLSLQNVGSLTCTMRGFPGVSVLDSSGAIIQKPADRDSVTSALVTLSPGQVAAFTVRFSDPSIPGTGCSTTAKPAQIQVYPPDQTQSLRAPTTLTPCDLVVRPVTAG